MRSVCCMIENMPKFRLCNKCVARDVRSFVLVVYTDWCGDDLVAHKQDVDADQGALEVIENHADAPCIGEIRQKKHGGNGEISKHTVHVCVW